MTNYKKGFTLVELVVTLGIFGVIMIVGSNFLIQTIKNANQAAVQNEIRQNASAILQDIVTQARQAYCIYYLAPTPPSVASLIRISDDPNDGQCLRGNRVEYSQDQAGIVTRSTFDSLGTLLTTGQLTSGKIVVLNCSSGESACGVASGCSAPGLTMSSTVNPAVNGVPATISIRAQQVLGQTRSDYCAAVTLSDTITPRVK